MITLQAAIVVLWLAAMSLFISGAMAVQRAYEADVIRGELERTYAELRARIMEEQRRIGMALLPVMSAMAVAFQPVLDAFNEVMQSAGTSIQEWSDRLRQEPRP